MLWPKKESKTDKKVHVADFDSAEDSMAEAFRMLRLHLDHLLDKHSLDSKGKTLLITSALPNEGKTTVASNLSLAAASSGRKTLLIDSDCKNPFVHKAFNCPRSPGLTDYLLDHPETGPVMSSNIHENLKVLSAGRKVKQSHELLLSKDFDVMMARFKQHYDLIVLDSPPIGMVADAGIIASKVNHIYMAVRTGKTSFKTIEKATQSLMKLGVNIDGVIMTRCNLKKNKYYYYSNYPGYYSNYYNSDQDD